MSFDFSKLANHASILKEYENFKVGDLYLHQLISIISLNVYFKSRKGSIKPAHFGDAVFNYIVLAFIGPILMGKLCRIERFMY